MNTTGASPAATGPEPVGNVTPLLYDVDGGIATITLNRPDRMNSASVEMVELWCDALSRARRDDAVRVVIVTGAGERAFCTGADLTGGKLGDPDFDLSQVDSRGVLRDTLHGIARELRLLDKPYLAAVNGAAYGAGMDFASMADLRFASDTARFSMAYVKVGIIPGDGGAFYLPRLIGLSRALHLIWTGETIGAEQALEWGYLHAVLPADDLLAGVRSYAERLVTGPNVAIRLAKRLVYQSLDSSEEQALELAATMMPIVMATEDAREGPKAFVERRPPRFLSR